MKKKQVNALAQGSPEYVIAHASWRRKRGRQPSVAYLKERNPRKALALAKQVIALVKKVVHVAEKQWNVISNNTVIAQIHLDYNDQISKVVMMTNDEQLRRSVKELALSHAIQFIIQRSPLPGELLALVPERELEEHTCENMMSFKMIPSGIAELSNEKLDQYLSGLANVVEGMFDNLEAMLGSLLIDIQQNIGVLLGIRKVQSVRWDEDHITVTFEIQDNHNFKIWKDADGAKSSWRLHFTAPYHPVMAGKKSLCLINGSTDAYIRGGEAGIYSVYSPEEAKVKEKGSGTSWSYIKHPFYAEGKTLGVEISITLCLAKTGYQSLYNLLVAALNKGDKYVAVSGGFNSPYDHVGNVLSRKGIKSPAGRHGAYDYRGSEDDCVWEHEVLKAEGKLTGALVPDWFHREGWTEIFAGEKRKFA